jgi:hypothetical protein
MSAGDVRCCVSDCGLPHPVLCLAQRLEGLLVGSTFSNDALPAAIPPHGLNLLTDTIPICASTLFRQGHAREEKKRQGQEKLSEHVALHWAGAWGMLQLSWATEQTQD